MTETAAGRRRLGRGLEALLGPTREEAEREGSLVELPIKDVRPNPFQPRKTVDPTALEAMLKTRLDIAVINGKQTPASRGRLQRQPTAG